MFRHATLGDTLYFWFALNSTAGEATDATGTPTYDVREGGASSSGAPTLEGNATLLSHANYPAGLYEIAVAATGGNGFAADKEYAVFCQATVSSVNPTGFVGGFRLAPVPANTTQLAGQTVSASGTVTFPNATLQREIWSSAGATVNLSGTTVKEATDVQTTLTNRLVGTIATGTHNPQSGDAYAVVNNGTHGNAALKTLIDLLATAAAVQAVDDNVDTLLTRLTATRAGYLDNLNVGGAVASQADINAINQSASRRILLTTVGQYERPESGSTTYTIEARTFDGDGAAVNADSNPTLTGTGQTSGSLAANIGSITNPATGVYRWAYTVSSGATIEPARFDVSATISSSTFTLSVYTQVVDLVGTTFTTADRDKLEAVYNKLPSKDYLAGTANSDGDVQMDEATGNFPGSVASVAGAVGSVTGNVGGNVAGSVGSVTAGVTLADDAITASKFDETTAFPLKAADTGATTVARVGADGDTLETLSDQLDAIPTTIRLKKNTAFNNFTFPMLDTAGDPATGATVTGQVALDGGTFANLTNSVSELSSGVYKVNLAAADLNGNDAMLKFTASGCKTLFIKVVLQP